MKKYLIFLVLICCSCTGQPTKVVGSWETERGNNQRTGYVDVNVTKKEPKVKVKKEITSYPIVNKGIAYFISSNGEFSAFDIEKENELWKIKIDLFTAHFAIDNNVIFFAGYGEKGHPITAIDSNTQEKIWQIKGKTPNLISGITVEDNIVFISGYKNTAYDAKTGEELWEFIPETLDTPQPLLIKLAIFNDVLYIGDNTYFYALDLKTGKEIWKIEKKTNYTPVATSEKIFILDNLGTLYAHNANDGKEIWNIEISAGTLPSVGNGTIYIISRNKIQDNKLHAIDIETGTIKWVRDMEQAVYTSEISVVNDAVLLAGFYKDSLAGFYEDFLTDYSVKLFAINTKDGKDIWQVNVNYTPLPNIIPLNNAILYTGEEDLDNSYLYILK